MKVDVLTVAEVRARLDENAVFREMYLKEDTSKMNAVIDGVRPRPSFLPESNREECGDRARAYDWPRIRYFRDRFRAGKHVNAVNLTLDEDGGLHVYNGYHRLVGALLSGAKTMRVHLRIYGRESARQLDNIRRSQRKAA